MKKSHIGITKMDYRMNKFKERLNNLNEWLTDTLNYEEQRSLNFKATLEVYDGKPILSLLYKMYLLPTLILNYLGYARKQYYIKKCKKEIQLIQNVLNNANKKI